MVAPIVTDGGKPSTPDFFVGVPEILDKVRKGGVVLKNDLDVEIADGEVNWLLVVGGSVFSNKIQVKCFCWVDLPTNKPTFSFFRLSIFMGLSEFLTTR